MNDEMKRSKYLLIYEAKAFYNAYINLERINNAFKDERLLIPTAVNGAFSIELTLKAILSNQGIKYDKEHNIASLFLLLPSEIQQMIWEWVEDKTPEYKDSYRRNKELVIVSDVFKQWRYLYEGNLIPAFDLRFLSSFANACIGVMFSLGYNVEWASTIADKSQEEIDELIEINREACFDHNIKNIEKRNNHHQS